MSTRYVLSKPYRLRGWYKLPMGLYSTVDRKAIFASKEDYLLLLKCDGAHDLTADTMSEAERATLEELLANEVVRPALLGEFLKPEQAHKSYLARYRESVHWSITGACNLKCRHCFMSAPNAKHGSPAHEQLMDVVEQLAECGVCSVGITGGEPLVRKDFLDIVDALVEREIAVSTAYTNGWLDDEVLLDELEKRGVHAGFQLSFDGVGCHDFLRGVSGAEEKTLAIMLHGSFMYNPGDSEWASFHERPCSVADEQDALACGMLGKNFYIGADGMVSPCMGMCDTGFAHNFPNLRETPLREILQDSRLVDLCYAKVADVRDKSGKCRSCELVDRCAGGCRNSALLAGDNYYGPDPDSCAFFDNGWDKRIREVAQPAFEAYLRRCPPKQGRDAAKNDGSYLD